MNELIARIEVNKGTLHGDISYAPKGTLGRGGSEIMPPDTVSWTVQENISWRPLVPDSYGQNRENAWKGMAQGDEDDSK